jgi:tetratricopeptide (TPR) repeat protein
MRCLISLHSLLVLDISILKNMRKAIEWFNAAEKYCPVRNEHIVHLAQTYDELQQYDKMLEQTTRLINPERKLPFPDYYFLIDNNIYCDSGDYPQYIHDYALSKISEEKSINSFSINITTKPRLWIVDDFYTDPHAVRDFALQQEFDPNLDYYKGK